jgi:hypothetical protein
VVGDHGWVYADEIPSEENMELLLLAIAGIIIFYLYQRRKSGTNEPVQRRWVGAPREVHPRARGPVGSRQKPQATDPPVRGTPITPVVEGIPEHLAVRYEVASHSEKGVSYDVYLSDLTCSCPDFVKRRQFMPAMSPGRCCKHIEGLLRKHGILESQTDFVKMLILDPYDPRSNYLEFPYEGRSVILGFTPGQEWVDVYAAAKKGKGGAETGEMTKFGFSVTRPGWSYGTSPYRSVPIKEAILSLARSWT